MIKSILSFVPAKWRVRGETKAVGEAHLALGEESLLFWQERLGWSPESAKYLATAFAFGVRDNVAEVLAKAQELSASGSFEDQFGDRVRDDPSIAGATLEASKFVSSDELRDLLGRILASDIGQPGSVSRRAVSVAQDLTPTDLAEFLKLRSATWRTSELGKTDFLLVIGRESSFRGDKFISFGSKEMGIDFHTFGEFQQLGLLQERGSGVSFWLDENLGSGRIANGMRTVWVNDTTEENGLTCGMYLFTKAGQEILSLFVDQEFVKLDGYFEEVCGFWRGQGLDVVETDQ